MDVLEIMYELMPPWAATALFGGLGLAAGIGGSVWRSHEKAQLALCSSSAGEMTQLFNGAAQASCGASSVLSLIALLLAIAGFVIFGIFVIVFLVLASKGKLQRAE